MTVFLNGRFVDEAEAFVPVTDRSFLYGDGLFETIRVHDSRLFKWPRHLDRLLRGAAALGIELPIDSHALFAAACGLVRRNALLHGILRLHLSRGSGPRGYSPRGAHQPLVLMTAQAGSALDPRRSGFQHLITASLRLPDQDPLAAFKTANKLTHILARAEASARGADDALLLNTRGELAESSCANLFWFDRGGICTPPRGSGALAGTTQAFVRGLALDLGWSCREMSAPVATLTEAPGGFLTSSGPGLVGIASLDGHPLARDARLERLGEAFMEALPAALSDELSG